MELMIEPHPAVGFVAGGAEGAELVVEFVSGFAHFILLGSEAAGFLFVAGVFGIPIFSVECIDFIVKLAVVNSFQFGLEFLL